VCDANKIDATFQRVDIQFKSGTNCPFSYNLLTQNIFHFNEAIYPGLPY
jgi:hypothetical protein